MKGRILFTGNGKVIWEDLMAHTPSDYRKKSCAPAERLFLNTIDDYKPHVIVVCVQKCVPEMLQMYDALENDSRYRDIALIVIGNEEDSRIFRSRIVHANMKILVRPIDYDEYLRVLDRLTFEALEREAEEKRRQWEQEEEERKRKAQEEKRLQEENLHTTGLAGERKSILVVDDDVRMLNVLKLYLQDLYDVTVVPSGKLALKFLNKKHADLVLLDYLMPEMDGPEVLRRIKEETPCPDIPVIFLTGVSDKDLVIRGLSLNPSGYILKPVTREKLLERVTGVLLGIS